MSSKCRPAIGSRANSALPPCPVPREGRAGPPRPRGRSGGSRLDGRGSARVRRADQCRAVEQHAARLGQRVPAAGSAVGVAVVPGQAPSDMARMRGVERQRRRTPFAAVEPHAHRRVASVDPRQRGEAFAAGGLRDGLLERPDGREAPGVAPGPGALAIVQIELEPARVDSRLDRLDIDADRPCGRDRASDPVPSVREAEFERQIEPRTPVCRVVQRGHRRLAPTLVGERGEQQPRRDQAAVTRRRRRPAGDLPTSRNRQLSEPQDLECGRDLEDRAQMDRHRGTRPLRPIGRQTAPIGRIACA